jgi:hypothetical protein
MLNFKCTIFIKRSDLGVKIWIKKNTLLFLEKMLNRLTEELVKEFFPKRHKFAQNDDVDF